MDLRKNSRVETEHPFEKLSRNLKFRSLVESDAAHDVNLDLLLLLMGEIETETPVEFSKQESLAAQL